MSFIRNNKGFCVFFLLAVIIRFIPAFSYQFSYDELCGIRNSLFHSWHDMVHLGVSLDTHPVLVQLIINGVARIFGYSEFWIKLPFLLFSLAAIFYAYIFAAKWFGRLPALLTTAIFSFSYIFLFYAPLARMYAGGLFFSTALTYYLFNLCFDEQKKKSDYILFVLFILLCALNNHLSCLYALSCGVFGLFFQTKKTLFKYLAACIIAVILYLPHLSITLTQLAAGGIGHGQDGWLPAPDKLVLFSLIKTLLGTGYVWLVFAVLILLAIILKRIKIERKAVYLFVLFFCNYGIIHLYSVVKAPIFQYSVMLFSAACFIWALTSMMRITDRKCFAVAVVPAILLLVQSVWKKDFFTNAVLNQNEFQSIKYCDVEDKNGKGSVEALYGAAQPYFVVHYEVKYKRPFQYHLKTNDFAELKNNIQNSTAKLFILGDPSYTELELVKEKFPYLIDRKQCLNVNNYIFSKSSSHENIKGETVLDSSRLVSPGHYEYNYNKEKFSSVYKIDSLDEFPFAVKAPLNKVGFKEGQVILAKVKVQSAEPLSDVGFNFSISNAKDSTLFFGGPEMKLFYEKTEGGYWAYSEVFLGSEFKNWLKQGGKITFFIWNRGRHKFTLSDCQVKTYDYWPSRWTWWD